MEDELLGKQGGQSIYYDNVATGIYFLLKGCCMFSDCIEVLLKKEKNIFFAREFTDEELLLEGRPHLYYCMNDTGKFSLRPFE